MSEELLVFQYSTGMNVHDDVHEYSRKNLVLVIIVVCSDVVSDTSRDGKACLEEIKVLLICVLRGVIHCLAYSHSLSMCINYDFKSNCH